MEKKNVKVVNFEEQSRKIYFALKDEDEAYKVQREAGQEKKVRIPILGDVLTMETRAHAFQSLLIKENLGALCRHVEVRQKGRTTLLKVDSTFVGLFWMCPSHRGAGISMHHCVASVSNPVCLGMLVVKSQ